MRALLVLLTLLIVPTISYPCGNEYGETLDGTRMYGRYFYLSPDMRIFNEGQLKEHLNDLYRRSKGLSGDYKIWSDIAVNLMKLGKADSAVKILAPLVAKYPKEYNILANLGTAYELVGALDSALKYISKGFEVNPQSHNGSEWIHVKILEAKILEKQSPGWLAMNPIVEIQDIVERFKGLKESRLVYTANRHFSYQIRTRAPFTPAPNKVMANLMTALGDFNTEHGTYENALLAYANALEYQDTYYVERSIKDRIRELNRKRSARTDAGELSQMFLWMMKRSKINPELLVSGLREYSMRLDSLETADEIKQDSFVVLQLQLDSIESALKDEKTDRDKELAIAHSQKHRYLGFGALIGGILALVLFFVWKVMGRKS